MDKEGYKLFKSVVQKFFESEGIVNLTAEIGEDSDHECPICGETVGCDP